MNYKIDDLVKVIVSHPVGAVYKCKDKVGRICNIEEMDNGKILYTIAFHNKWAFVFVEDEFILATDNEIRNTLIEVLETPHYV